MQTTNSPVAQSCSQAHDTEELNECIASGQASAAQIEAHRSAGEVPALKTPFNGASRTLHEPSRDAAVDTLLNLGFAYLGGSRWAPPVTAKPQPTRQSDGELIAMLSEALRMLVGRNALHSLCRHEGVDMFGRVKGTWSAEAEARARSAIAALEA